MAYNPEFLGGPVVFGITGGNASGPRQKLWTLDSTDTLATIVGAGFISDGVSRGMAKGDLVFVRRFDTVTARATLSGMSQHYVASLSATAASLSSDWDTSLDTDLAEQATMEALSVSSKATDAAVVRFVAPWAFTIKSVQTVINAALATGDATVTLAIGATPVTNGVVTITNAASAAGDVDSATPTAARTGAAGALITATVGGASTATATLNVFLLLERTS
jgi:hypothetical protein